MGNNDRHITFSEFVMGSSRAHMDETITEQPSDNLFAVPFHAQIYAHGKGEVKNAHVARLFASFQKLIVARVVTGATPPMMPHAKAQAISTQRQTG